MNAEEFDRLMSQVRERRAPMERHEDISVFDFQVATDDDIRRVEGALDVALPEAYKDFMRRYGGGQFLFVDLLPVLSADGRSDDVLTVNSVPDARSDFVAVSPVGTGDFWGFLCRDGVCVDQVSFMGHEDGEVAMEAADFYEFVARRGLRHDQ